MWQRRLVSMLMVGSIAVLGAGCAHRERPTVRLHPGEKLSLTELDLRKQSLVVELHPGQVVPLDISVEGDLIGSPKGASVPLTVKRHCFLRIDDRGLRLSDNGRDFDVKASTPGSFQLGVGVTEAGTRANLRLTTPVR